MRDDSSIYLPHPDDYFDFESSLDDNMSMHSLNANAVTSPTLDSSKDETEVCLSATNTKNFLPSKKHSSLRRIASLFGLSRLTSDRDWNTLLPDTQRKKVVENIKKWKCIYSQRLRRWSIYKMNCTRFALVQIGKQWNMRVLKRSIVFRQKFIVSCSDRADRGLFSSNSNTSIYRRKNRADHR